MDILQKFLDSEISDRKILNNFLMSEINSIEFYKCIIDFIDSFEIRRGEFEGNEFIIMKMDRENFILYPERDYRGSIEIPYSLAIYKNVLKEAINTYAKQQNIIP